jgi:hypothetical protein
VFQPQCDSDEEGGGFEDDTIDDQLLRDIVVDRLTPDADHGGPISVNNPFCQPVQYTIQVWTLVQMSSAVQNMPSL